MAGMVGTDSGCGPERSGGPVFTMPERVVWCALKVVLTASGFRLFLVTFNQVVAPILGYTLPPDTRMAGMVGTDSRCGHERSGGAVFSMRPNVWFGAIESGINSLGL
jgi:hypothetical protein